MGISSVLATGVRSGRRAIAVGLAVVVGMTACGDATSGETETAEATETSETTSTSSTLPSVRELEDGRLEPGRYRDLVKISCDDPPISCPDGPPPPFGIELTVPDGWGASTEYGLIHPAIADGASPAQATEGPYGAGLVLGWATVWVGVNSDPCVPVGHPTGHVAPDISVGPAVDDFVDAVVAHPTLEVSEPTDVTVGGYDGRFFTLTAPSDLSGCDFWRPWEPGIYAQGPGNVWDVWALDIDGLRVVMVAQHFPATPEEVRRELREIVQSMTFEPAVAG